jgi:hypothetical protein
MPLNNEFLLVDYLDKNLAPEEAAQAEQLIRSDKQVASEWEYLKLAVEATELGAIREQVMQVRRSLAEGVSRPSGAVVRRIYKITLRAAAILILLMGVSIFYKYNRVNNAAVYNQYFTDYTLPVSRGSNQTNALEEAYRNKNWNAVLQIAAGQTGRTNEAYFLAGLADLKLKKFPEAVQQFGQVLAANAASGDTYYQDEAEYYLSLACLMNGETEKAVALLDKIRGNRNHTYYPLARQISSTDLKIIELKAKK